MHRRLIPLLLVGCATVDPDVFDDRLRAATFDAYVAELDLQCGDVQGRGVDRQALEDRYRDRAISAADPVAFYRVIAEMLGSLGDPHVDLAVSPRHWPKVVMGSPPVELQIEAVPFGHEIIRVDGSLYLGHALGDERRWSPLQTIDGVGPTWSGAELLMRGQIATELVAEVDDGGRTRELRIVRDAGRVTGDDGVVRIVGPEMIERLVAQANRQPQSPAPLTPVSVAAEPALFARGSRVRAADSGRLDWRGGLEAWRLDSVAYLRVGSFRVAGEDWEDYCEAIDGACRQLAGAETWVIDLLGNRGGAWVAMGYFVSRFLDRRFDVVPHELTVKTLDPGWLVTRIETTTTRIPRADVPTVEAERIIVLVDQWTASAAEITAATLRGCRDALLVGDWTGGAESHVHRFAGPDGSAIEFTAAGGMTHGLEHFQGRGLEPDVVVELTADRLGDRRLDEIRRRFAREVRTAGIRAAGLDPQAWLTR